MSLSVVTGPVVSVLTRTSLRGLLEVFDHHERMHRLFQVLTAHLIGRFAPVGVVELACDDTLFHHEGRTVEGAGVFRDAVLSTLRRVVFARGLNLVVITLTVNPRGEGARSRCRSK